MTIRSFDDRTLADAAEFLRAGELVAFPTETVYGLGADATNPHAVAKIFATKGRPRFNPLIAHIVDLEAAQRLAIFDDLALRLAEQFWPGPLTLVLPIRPHSGIADLVTAGLDTIALRLPAHPIAQALLQAVGRPVAAPSANRSGHVSATTAAHVAADLGAAVALILDGGATEVGLESTILAVTSGTAQLLRPGGLQRHIIEAAIGPIAGMAIATGPASQPNSPGQLASHYAPAASLRLDVAGCRPGEALLAFGANLPEHDGAMVNLSQSGDLMQAAVNLFAALRTLDATGAASIAVMPIPDHGLGEAINDRLRRAAAPKPADLPWSEASAPEIARS